MMVRFSPRSEFQSGSSRSGEYPAGPREGRFPERLPAASIGSAQAGCFIPFKAIVSREIQSAGGEPAVRPAVALSSCRSVTTAGRSMKRFAFRLGNVSHAAPVGPQPSGPRLEFRQVAQALRDVLAVGAGLLLLSSFAVGIGAAGAVVFVLVRHS